MEPHPTSGNRPIGRDHPPAARWVKEWVPQETAVTRGTCSLLKWVREDMLEALQQKSKKLKVEDPKPEPTTELLYLCSYEGCGKIFIDLGALNKHVQTHGERKHVCHYEGCGKKFSDKSKLKRHFLVHTGKKTFKCHYEGCGKAFSLSFNLTSHLRTHMTENYHVCPYPECGRRYTDEYKLQSHITARHEKNAARRASKEKLHRMTKATASASCDRPYVCPFEGCRKAYIHRYKLNLHLKKEHPDHDSPENGKPSPPMAAAENSFDDTTDRDAYIEKHNKTKYDAGVPNGEGYDDLHDDLPIQTVRNTVEKQWQSEEMHGEDSSSEETEEERGMFDELGYEEANNEETQGEV